MANSLSQTDRYFEGNSKITNLFLELINGRTEESIVVNGTISTDMAMEPTRGQMDASTKEIGRMTRDMEKVAIGGLMVTNMKESLLMEKDGGKVFSGVQTVKSTIKSGEKRNLMSSTKVSRRKLWLEPVQRSTARREKEKTSIDPMKMLQRKRCQDNPKQHRSNEDAPKEKTSRQS